MKASTVALCACLTSGLAAGACGDDSDDSASTPGGQGQPAASEAETTGRLPARVAVSMKDIAFEPAAVTVPKGGTVIWTNAEAVGHDVTKTGGPGRVFNSGAAGGMAKGDTFKQIFETAGTVDYVCRVHVGMEGTVTVRDARSG